MSSEVPPKNCSTSEPGGSPTSLPTTDRQHEEDGQENRAGEGQAGHREVEEIGGGFAGTHAGDVAAVALEVLRDLRGLEHHRHPEVGEQEDADAAEDVIPGAAADEFAVELGGPGLAGEEPLQHHRRQREHRGGEDDRHHAGVVHLERQILRLAAELFAADDALGVLHGDAALRLGDGNGGRDDDEQQRDHHHHHDGAEGAAITGDEVFPRLDQARRAGRR